jgi:hypothetical protein
MSLSADWPTDWGDWNALVQGLAGFAVIWLILFAMYKKDVFIKI